ncbi:Ubiquitin recognition factor in ER-associated degradation protein 1 [Agyrium rufum]|nr:Ubiquitin recognition factor in ER-associated degradation protein 1 [Agyrium rufum]
MYAPNYYDEDGMNGMYPPPGMLRRPGQVPRRFDEYYRCYPIAMMPGPERESANHGGKLFLPASALDKLTRLHIMYPMLFDVINGAQDKKTHAGVLEFTAEEGKVYLPFWMMQTLLLEPGDLVQIKSTELPSGSFIKLQAQSTSFLDISDPKAVLENAFRNFSCLTKGDIFTFAYNDQVYEMAVLETKPDPSESHAISVLETDLEVDFAAPVGYEEQLAASKKKAAATAASTGTSTPRSGMSGAGGGGHLLASAGGTLHSQGTMAQSINYASIAPFSSSAAAGAKAVSSNFLAGGQRLNARKKDKAPTPKPSTPVAGTSSNTTNPAPPPRRSNNGPQPLRLPPGMLFFGYEIKPLRKKDENGLPKPEQDEKPRFQGQGQSLRAGGKKRPAPVVPEVQDEEADKENVGTGGVGGGGGGQKLGGGKRDARPY